VRTRAKGKPSPDRNTSTTFWKLRLPCGGKSGIGDTMKKPSLTALAGAATKEGFQVHTKPGFFSKDQFGWNEF
jgi:hypothetical protein